MQTSRTLFAVAAFAAAFAGGASANEAIDSQRAIQFEGSRTRAEVRAEAVEAVRNRSTERFGSRALAPLASNVDVQALRADTVRAVRLGQIPAGDVGRI